MKCQQMGQKKIHLSRLSLALKISLILVKFRQFLSSPIRGKMFTAEERSYLLRAARKAIESETGVTTGPEIGNTPPALFGQHGVFVTIYKGNRLRGCIGYVEETGPLIDIVREVAVKAAVEDPRFPPLKAEELSQTRLEISVLSTLEPIDDFEKIEIGRDGLIIEMEGRRGLLLPQVAEEYGWERDEFLSNTAMKAGLPPNAWQDPSARIFRFSAEVFSEETFPKKRSSR